VKQRKTMCGLSGSLMGDVLKEDLVQDGINS
jgi:hypothetical protein